MIVMQQKPLFGLNRGFCILDETKLCENCGECEKCDLDPNKYCDNCGKCIEFEDEYAKIKIDDIML